MVQLLSVLGLTGTRCSLHVPSMKYISDNYVDNVSKPIYIYFERYWKEGNVLFNDALNTFYLRLYGVRHMVKDHSDSEE